MLIEPQITFLIESMRKLQSMVQLGTQTSSLDKIKSQKLLADCETTVVSLFKLPTKDKVRPTESHNNNELVTLITAVAHDTVTIFKILDTLPVLKGMRPTSFNRREDNGRVFIDFTMKNGFIRGELWCSDKRFYIIQYEDTTYSCMAEENVTVL